MNWFIMKTAKQEQTQDKVFSNTSSLIEIAAMLFKIT